MSCSGNKQWYVCTKGNFRGCCSVDPCSTGVCPDDSGDSSSGGDGDTTTSKPESPSSQATSSPAATSETTASESSSAEPTTQYTPTPSSSQPPTQTITAFAETNGTTTTTTTTPPPGNPSSDEASFESPVSAYNRKAVIGGAVAGGLVGLVLLVLGIFWLVRRSRKRRNRRFRLLQWHGPQYQHENESGNEKSGYDNGDREKAGVAPCVGREGNANADDNGEGSGPGSGPGPYINTSQENKPYTTLSTTAETPISALSSTTRLLARTPPSLSSSPEQKQPHGKFSASIFITPPPPPRPSLRPLDAIPSSPSSPLTLIPPPIKPTTPELGDTGFYRQRAELPTDSKRELINIPQEERMNRQRTQIQTQTQTDDTEREINGKTHIVTPDGAVLASNFERSPGCRDYVTNFMQCYDVAEKQDIGMGMGMGLAMGLGIEFKDELPGYYPVMLTDIKTSKEEEKDTDVDMTAAKEA